MSKPTKRQIRALQIEAGVHGDTAMVECCEQALSGEEGALVDVALALDHDGRPLLSAVEASAAAKGEGRSIHVALVCVLHALREGDAGEAAAWASALALRLAASGDLPVVTNCGSPQHWRVIPPPADVDGDHEGRPLPMGGAA